MRRHTPALTLFASLCLMAFAGSAAAQSTWGSTATFNYGTGTGSCDVPTNCVNAGVTLSVSGWGNTGGGSYQQGLGTSSSVTTNSAGSRVFGGLSNQGGSGLGFSSRTGSSTQETGASPQHAFDNDSSAGTSNEVLLLNFNGANVNLRSIMTGWSTNDTDVMVFRWDGSSGPNLSGTAGPNALISSGWSLVSAKDLDGSVSATVGDTGAKTFDLSTGVGWGAADVDRVSSYWLISSYFGGTGVTNGLNGMNLSGTGLGDSSLDYFKLLAFSGNVCTGAVDGGRCVQGRQGVPEPASLALVALALAGVAATRRRAPGPQV